VLVASDAGSRRRGLLRGIRRAFAGALETDRSGRRPANRAAIWSDDGDDRVVERRLNAGHAVRHHPAFALLLKFLLALGRRFPSSWCCDCLLLPFFRHVTPLSIRSRLLSATGPLTCGPWSSSWRPLHPS